MSESAGRGRRAWFWIGVVSLSVSVLFWVIMILGAMADSKPVDVGSLLLGGVLLTFAPIGLGIYCVMRGMKVRGEKPSGLGEGKGGISIGTRIVKAFVIFCVGSVIIAPVWIIVGVSDLPLSWKYILFIVPVMLLLFVGEYWMKR